MPYTTLINHAERIRRALDLAPAADRDLPAELADALAVVRAVEAARTEGTAAAVLTDLITTAPAGTFDDALDDAALRWLRTDLVHSGTAALDRAYTARLSAALTTAIPEAIGRLTAVFDAAVAELTAAADALPAGASALEPAAVLTANASTAFHTAQTAGTHLQAVGAVHHTVQADPEHGIPYGVHLLPVISLTGEVERLTWHHDVDASSAPINDPRITTRVRAIRDAFADAGSNPLLALVRTARGDYGQDVRLEVARDTGEISRRRETVRTAHYNVSLKGSVLV